MPSIDTGNLLNSRSSTNNTASVSRAVIENVVFPGRDSITITVAPGKAALLTMYGDASDVNISLDKVLMSSGMDPHGTAGCCKSTHHEVAGVRATASFCNISFGRCCPLMLIDLPGTYLLDVSPVDASVTITSEEVDAVFARASKLLDCTPPVER